MALQGTVQGVGFRPFVYRLASNLCLTGWVRNTPAGVLLEVEGASDRLRNFQTSLQAQKPANCLIYSSEVTVLDPVGYTAFEIRESLTGEKSAVVLPDIATCPACLRELFDPGNRRCRYPFINCTHCGPRFSIIESLPYDRANTSMKRFEMCASCKSEYEDPADRRFHAQPNACPECGPWLELWRKDGSLAAERDQALVAAVHALREGRILALKGIGGFQLLVDARNDQAVLRLRQVKDREEKPFALMYPSLERLEYDCVISRLEQELLLSPAAPIVLLTAKSPSVSPHVAPRNPYLGVMLPYSPLHHLLLADLGSPVVATSGNAKDEPICTDEHDALVRLNRFVDLFLVHNRPVVRPVDDSVVRTLMGREAVMRRARGYAPLPVTLSGGDCGAVLGVGAHLKNTVALSVGHRAFVSQHLGDLETLEARKGFEAAVTALQVLYEARPAHIACDLHPDYESTRYARRSGLPLTEVQHHYAHVLSCMAENDLDPPALGVSWDGTGYGLDATVWGGEFLEVNEDSFVRLAHFAPFGLPGADQAVREPRRSALGLLHGVFGDDCFEMTNLEAVASFSSADRRLLKAALTQRLNCPLTSSAGRLFDAIAALAGLRQISTFEGQAAMELEFALSSFQSDESYSIDLLDDGAKRPILINWEPLVRQVIANRQSFVPAGLIAARFHNALVEAIVAVAKRARQNRVVLTGGCFQNRYLTERAIMRLRQEGFRPYWHQRIPPNDGGISLGQVAAVTRSLRRLNTTGD
ncbi:MAG: carbamoyltransferase HypF [Acidobacteriota bacterium]